MRSSKRERRGRGKRSGDWKMNTDCAAAEMKRLRPDLTRRQTNCMALGRRRVPRPRTLWWAAIYPQRRGQCWRCCPPAYPADGKCACACENGGVVHRLPSAVAWRAPRWSTEFSSARLESEEPRAAEKTGPRRNGAWACPGGKDDKRGQTLAACGGVSIERSQEVDEGVAK